MHTSTMFKHHTVQSNFITPNSVFDDTFQFNGMNTSLLVQNSFLPLFFVANSTFDLLDTNLHAEGTFPSIVEAQNHSRVIVTNLCLDGLGNNSYSQTEAEESSKRVHAFYSRSMLGQFQFTKKIVASNLTLPSSSAYPQRPIHPSHDWMISESSISECRGATSGIVFADQNWADSFTCLNSTFLDSPSMLTTRNDASSSTVSYLLAVIINTKKVMQDPACITVTGPDLSVWECNISSTTTYNDKHANNRGIFFDSPNGTLRVDDTFIHKFSSRTSGAGLFIGNSRYIDMHHSFLYRLYCGGNGASIAIFGQMEQMISTNNVFDKCLAAGSSRVNAGGIFLQSESVYHFSMEATTIIRQSSNGIGGGVAFVGIRPFTTINIRTSWFIKNIGRKSRKMEANGGSIAFGELKDPTGIKVTIETCRFNASSTGGRGRDIFCEKGWETIMTKEALPCSVAHSSKCSIYVEGVTGPSDDFWMNLDSPPECGRLSPRPPYRGCINYVPSGFFNIC
ncbi:hypothetical protein BLNAU_7130 [Blattamonas nauphoetae]|uniref:Right handed beta helix domain-containing protein n=1 Tax=Blattamonas nauphoetae TaxID=2049346 RepID=A0ABQ9Y2R7_9EUKA|nr:hypothetical protein BLNAU_7130 [Blattamonas nauphoetae]